MSPELMSPELTGNLTYGIVYDMLIVGMDASWGDDLMDSLLVLDDHRDACKVIVDVLEFYGYEVCMSHTIADALKVLEDETIDLLLADINLPDGVVLNAIEKFKDVSPDTKIILMSGKISFTTRAVRIFGAADFIGKPFKPKPLLTLIQKTMEL